MVNSQKKGKRARPKEWGTREANETRKGIHGRQARKGQRDKARADDHGGVRSEWDEEASDARKRKKKEKVKKAWRMSGTRGGS